MGDLISRQAAIDMFQNLAYDDWNQGVSTSWADAYAECAEMIKNLPSAQPERKKGKWIIVTDSRGRHVDDGQIVSVSCRKLYGDVARCEVEISDEG